MISKFLAKKKKQVLIFLIPRWKGEKITCLNSILWKFNFSVKVPLLHVVVALTPMLKILQIICKSQLCFLTIMNIKNISSSFIQLTGIYSSWFFPFYSLKPQNLFVWLDNKLAASGVYLKHLQRVSELAGPKQSYSIQSTCLFTKLQNKPMFSCFIWDKTHVGKDWSDRLGTLNSAYNNTRYLGEN